MTVQLILAVLPGRGARRVGPNVRAALLLGHRHAEEDATLAGGRPEAWVVIEGGHQGFPFSRQIGLRAERCDRGVRHRDRAAVPALHLGPHIEAGRSRRMRARAWLAPGQRVQPVADGDLHQPVPGWVELHLV